MLLLIRERDRETERCEKHRLIPSPMRPNLGLNLQPIGEWDDIPTNHPASADLSCFYDLDSFEEFWSDIL